MVNNNSSKFVAISAAIIICGLLSTMTCTSGTYEILSVADLTISQSDECIDLGDTRSYFPAQSKLNYAANSACTPGTLLCSRDRSNVRRWTPIDDMAPFTPADMGTEICNGIDDDCDGTIDNARMVGSQCTKGSGFCGVYGTYKCIMGSSSPSCDSPRTVSSPPGYYAYPYKSVNGSGDEWNWSCTNSMPNPYVPSGIIGKLATGSNVSTTISAAAIDFPLLSSIKDPPSGQNCNNLCMSNMSPVYQWYSASDKTIATSSPLPCGAIFKTIKCEYKSAVSSCQIGDVDTWSVFCR